jgi:hypothetical protein
LIICYIRFCQKKTTKMLTKRTNLSLHKSTFHKAYFVNYFEDMNLIDRIHDLSLREYPIEDSEIFILFDIEEDETISKHKNIEDVSLIEYPVEQLNFHEIFPNLLASINFPSTTICLRIGSGYGLTFLWYKDRRLDQLWMKIRNEIEIFNFLKNPTAEENYCLESSLRSIYNIELRELEIGSQINKLIDNIAESNVNELEISHIYLKDEDLKKLSKLGKITELRLSYNFNDNIFWLPINLKRLKIYGSTIQKLSQINFKKLKIIDLSLEANCINDLSDIGALPKSIKYINLNFNSICQFRIKELPFNLETLWLGNNLLDNSFFEGVNKDVENKSVKHLSLSSNHFKINNWLLKRIIKTFPMLEYLELEGNIAEGIDDSILINDDETSCVESIRVYLANEEHKNDGNFGDFESSFNYYGNNNKVIIKWKHESLPVDEILAGIDYVFKDYLKEMSELICFRDGLFCDFPHNETSMLIRGNTEGENSVEFNLYALNNVTFEKYFYRYFIEINRIISLNTHHYILPIINFSEGCNDFYSFYEKVYNLNEVLNKMPILYVNDDSLQLLVRKLTKIPLAQLREKTNGYNKIHSNSYKEIKNIAFVIDADPYVYPYCIDDNFSISNTEEKRKEYKDEEFFRINANSKERAMYSNCLKNKYLGKYSFQEGRLYLGDGKTVGPTIYFNSAYFKKVEDDIICIEAKTQFNYECLAHFEKNKKFFKLKIKDFKIVGSYEDLKSKIS